LIDLTPQIRYTSEDSYQKDRTAGAGPPAKREPSVHSELFLTKETEPMTLETLRRFFMWCSVFKEK
jgi:hypothetical protein